MTMPADGRACPRRRRRRAACSKAYYAIFVFSGRDEPAPMPIASSFDAAIGRVAVRKTDRMAYYFARRRLRAAIFHFARSGPIYNVIIGLFTARDPAGRILIFRYLIFTCSVADARIYASCFCFMRYGRVDASGGHLALALRFRIRSRHRLQSKSAAHRPSLYFTPFCARPSVDGRGIAPAKYRQMAGAYIRFQPRSVYGV